jgi:hypothetical protein
MVSACTGKESPKAKTPEHAKAAARRMSETGRDRKKDIGRHLAARLL